MPEKLGEALDRFSQFFISPLFTESATDREINAVDSEHEKNLSIDGWRVRQVNKSLADKNHPYHKVCIIEWRIRG
jgi:insulysin